MKTLLAILFLAATALAEEKPPQPQNFTHRVTGLFDPGRVDDLRTAMESLPDIKLVSVDFEHAEATFSYDPAVAFKGAKPAEVIERFRNRLKGASNHTISIEPVSTTPREKLTRIEIPVAMLDCKACCYAAYSIVSQIDGVVQATASSKDGRITAFIDPEKTSRPALEEILKKRGVTLKEP